MTKFQVGQAVTFSRETGFIKQMPLDCESVVERYEPPYFIEKIDEGGLVRLISPNGVKVTGLIENYEPANENKPYVTSSPQKIKINDKVFDIERYEYKIGCYEHEKVAGDRGYYINTGMKEKDIITAVLYLQNMDDLDIIRRSAELGAEPSTLTIMSGDVEKTLKVYIKSFNAIEEYGNFFKANVEFVEWQEPEVQLEESKPFTITEPVKIEKLGIFMKIKLWFKNLKKVKVPKKPEILQYDDYDDDTELEVEVPFSDALDKAFENWENKGNRNKKT